MAAVLACVKVFLQRCFLSQLCTGNTLVQELQSTGPGLKPGSQYHHLAGQVPQRTVTPGMHLQLLGTALLHLQPQVHSHMTGSEASGELSSNSESQNLEDYLVNSLGSRGSPATKT